MKKTRLWKINNASKKDTARRSDTMAGSMRTVKHVFSECLHFEIIEIYIFFQEMCNCEIIYVEIFSISSRNKV